MESVNYMFEGNQRNTCVEKKNVHAETLLQYSAKKKKISEPSAIICIYFLSIFYLSHCFYLFICFYVLAAEHVGSYLVPQPGMEPVSPALEVQSLNH